MDVLKAELERKRKQIDKVKEVQWCLVIEDREVFVFAGETIQIYPSWRSGERQHAEVFREGEEAHGRECYQKTGASVV